MSVSTYVRRKAKEIRKDRAAAVRFRRLAELEAPALQPAAPDERELVVSLTTYGDRLKTVGTAIKSIMDQTRAPNRVVLYLGEDTEEAAVPEDVRALLDKGVEIRGGRRDLRPHKKYVWAMREFPQADIITIDDDVAYTADTVESLMSTSKLYPNAVVARRAHRMRFDGNGLLLPYRNWEWEVDAGDPPSHDLLATGVGGVLYPAGSIPEDALDPDAISRIALCQDDLWLKAYETASNVPVVVAPHEFECPFLIPGTQEDSLGNVNVAQSANDRVLAACMSHVGITAADFQKAAGL